MSYKQFANNPATQIDLIRTWDAIADFLGVHRETAQRWGKTKGLPYARLMGRIVISTKEIITIWKNGVNGFESLLKAVDPISCVILGHEMSPHVDLEKMPSEIVVGWEQIGSLLGVNKLTAQSWAENEGMPVAWTMSTPEVPETSRKPYTTPAALQYWINWKIIKESA